jgi:hypothetical protein
MICDTPYHNWPETPIKKIGDTVIVHRGPLYVVRKGKEERYAYCDTMAERIAREMEAPDGKMAESCNMRRLLESHAGDARRMR